MAAPAARTRSALEALLADEIRVSGPISVARFMDLVLHHPEHGYYARRDPLGKGGDFTTAPEISQAFGEIIGLWLAESWRLLGAPAPVRLVELGPGRGTLMADVLRVARRMPGFEAAVRVHLIERSERLRARQRQTLAGIDVTWHDDFAEVPDGALFLIANEFLDALPIHQLVRTQAGWVERLVGCDQKGHLTFTLAPEPSPLAARLPMNLAPGTIAEVAPARENLAQQIGARLAADGGVALLIDYGAWTDGPAGDTLQAVRGHRPWEPLEAPGEADLSSQVDFWVLAEAAAAGGAAVWGPVPQGVFLRTLGIHLRIARLLERAQPEQRRELRAALFRLTDPSQMGELFKVLVLSRPGDPALPGFNRPTLLP